ncbi:alpha/beta fold hydrolase [uncultured Jatrophihabitans sp.]|uniref:alpha/beta fold hydrolase n=1 Tax=uncultured Jatrophihabitans sp. TaxID=1610747 RepID=UPI0035CC2027
MPSAVDVLFVQGGGAGVHDDWDAALVDSLRKALGASYQVHYPRMPHEDDPAYAPWSAAIAQDLAALGDDAVVVGHSVGATILVNYLAECEPPVRLRAIVLIAAPFVGVGGWPGEEFELPPDLGSRLPAGAPVHLFHGSDDQTAPPAHCDLYARAVPQAHTHLLPARDHQLNDDLGDVAQAIMRL